MVVSKLARTHEKVQPNSRQGRAGPIPGCRESPGCVIAAAAAACRPTGTRVLRCSPPFAAWGPPAGRPGIPATLRIVAPGGSSGGLRQPQPSKRRSMVAHHLWNAFEFWFETVEDYLDHRAKEICKQQDFSVQFCVLLIAITAMMMYLQDPERGENITKTFT